MILNWILYLSAAAGLFLFRVSYPHGISAYLLVVAALLPLLSLAYVLLARKQLRLVLSIPVSCKRGEKIASCIFFESAKERCVPSCKLTYRLTDCFGGTCEEIKDNLAGGLRLDIDTDTSHCGTVYLSVTSCRLYDLLGLFRIKCPLPRPVSCAVMPIPGTPDPCPDLSDLSETAFRPKPGGGFSEVHEFREYQPGDSVREINWKLTAKTDTVIIREPQIPVSVPVILCLDLRGTRNDMDNTLDCFLWLTEALFHRHVSLAVCYPDSKTGRPALLELKDPTAVTSALKTILAVSCPDRIPVIYSHLPHTAKLIRLGPPLTDGSRIGGDTV